MLSGNTLTIGQWNIGTPLIVIMCAIVALSILMIVVLVRVRRLDAVYKTLTRGSGGGNIEELLLDQANAVRQLRADLQTLRSRLDNVEAVQLQCLKNVAVIRYDAFEDVGGQQSFAMILTNSQDTGVAVSSVHSRNDVRVYAKEIRDGKSSVPLTDEEKRALRASRET